MAVMSLLIDPGIQKSPKRGPLLCRAVETHVHGSRLNSMFTPIDEFTSPLTLSLVSLGWRYIPLSLCSAQLKLWLKLFCSPRFITLVCVSGGLSILKIHIFLFLSLSVVLVNKVQSKLWIHILVTTITDLPRELGSIRVPSAMGGYGQHIDWEPI